MANPVYRQAGQIAFGDTDASGWMHFPSVFHYVENAEHAFLRSLGLLVFDRSQGGWPRVKVSCEFKHPFQFGDAFQVLLSISRLGTSSVTWEFEILNTQEMVAAQGSMTTVRVDHQGRAIPLSDLERSTLSVAPQIF